MSFNLKSSDADPLITLPIADSESVAMNTLSTMNLLAVDTGEPTPRTPEILNSLISLDNPLDRLYNSLGDTDKYLKMRHANKDSDFLTSLSNDSCSSTGSQSVLSSPGANNANLTLLVRPSSVQQTCSKLIKEGLKHSIQSKRKLSANGNDSSSQLSSSDLLDLDVFKKSRTVSTAGSIKSEMSGSDDESRDGYSNQSGSTKNEELTPEDEERRRRRRERNKIAATKCRLKKREKTFTLVHESETLTVQNDDLKSQISDLETQLQHLSEMLSQHQPNCVKNESRNSNQYQNAYEYPMSNYSNASENNQNHHNGYLNNNYFPNDCAMQKAKENRYPKVTKNCPSNSSSSNNNTIRIINSKTYYTSEILPGGKNLSNNKLNRDVFSTNEYQKASSCFSESFDHDLFSSATGDGDIGKECLV